MSSHGRRSPRIAELSWGRLRVEGERRIFKDAKLFPGGACEWDWSETGTRHRPGIQPLDVEELVREGARVVILSSGMLHRLAVCPETLRELERLKIPYHLLETRRAVELYNRLCEDQAVGGLFHTTC